MDNDGEIVLKFQWRERRKRKRKRKEERAALEERRK